MSSTAAQTQSPARRPVERFDERRDELAESALVTLAERGYARTSLRDIANNSTFSHGVVHYYFRDKTDLITYCVRYYKARCVTRYDQILAESPSAGDLCLAFAAKLAETLVTDAGSHRLWYDLRAQSYFETSLRNDVDLIDDTLEAMVWRVLERYAELAERRLVVDSGTAYAILDGCFEQALLDLTFAKDGAADTLSVRTRALLPSFLAPA